MQADKERPFFESLGDRSGLSLSVTYQPIDLMDMNPEEGLELVQHQIVDVASLSLAAISRRDPFFLGLGLVGLTPDYESAGRVVSAFSRPIETHLRETYNAKLLGIWPSGPQVLFCKPEISGLGDIRGLKIRVYDANLGTVIETLGATPVPVKFSAVKQALALEIVDCAITAPSSANRAGWVRETSAMLPLSFQIAFNAYAMNLDRWRLLTRAEQRALLAAFRAYLDDLWAYSEGLYQDALRCNVGKRPCTTMEPATLKEVPVQPGDRLTIRKSLATVSLPAWTSSCERLHTGCGKIWADTVGRAVSLN